MRISIPFAVDLTREDTWERASDHKYGYWVIRCHFQLRERQVDDRSRNGRKLAVVQSPTGMSQELIKSIRTELSAVQFRESFAEYMRQDESLAEFVASLASEIGASPVGKVSSALKSKAEQKLTTAFKNSYRIQDVVTQRIEKEYKLLYKVDPNKTDRMVAVAVYQRYAFDLYLTWVDYLSIRYIKRRPAIRKKRTKRPKPDGRNHPNWEKFNIALATAHFWKPLPESAVVVDEANYKNEIDDEEQIHIAPPEDTHQYVALRPSVPTLYQISNVAFPLKWVKRRGDWTESQLMEIEEGEPDEVKWFWQ